MENVPVIFGEISRTPSQCRFLQAGAKSARLMFVQSINQVSIVHMCGA